MATVAAQKGTMYMQVRKLIKAIVFGIMFFLAVTAPCTSETYDPDPYDGMWVTVEFHYLVQSEASVKPSVRQIKTRKNTTYKAQIQHAGAPFLIAFSEAAPSLSTGSPQVLPPLRR
jgi:hypothetical protein